MAAILNPDSPLSFLQQRLNYAKSFMPDALSLVENVPLWPIGTFAKNYIPANADMDSLVQCYANPQGEEPLLEQVRLREKACYQLNLPLENILITNGAQHGISLVAAHLRDNKAEVLCQGPVLRNIEEIFVDAGFTLNYFYKPRDKDKLLETLSKNINSNTKILYLNSPHNPVGDIWEPDELTDIIHYCQQGSITIIFDAVYDNFNFSTKSIVSPLSLTEQWDHLYVANSMSKNYGAPGLRIGWLMSAKNNILKLSGDLETQCISISPPSQYMATNLLKEGNLLLKKTVQDNYLRIQTLLLSYLPRDAFYLPEGGTQIILYLPVKDIEYFADYMLTEYQVILCTSSNYRGLTKEFIRLPLGQPMEDLEYALPLILQPKKPSSDGRYS